MTALPREHQPPYLAWLLGLVAVVTLYRLWALQHMGITLYVDEAYYWGWAQDPAWGYYSKPPMIGWLIAATTALFGDGLLGVKAGTFLVYPLTTLTLYALGKRLFDARSGFFVAFAFLTLPAVSLSGIIVSTDMLLFLFWSLALLFLLRALEGNRLGDWLLAGLFGGLGLLTKYTMGVFAISVLVYLLLDKDQRQQLANPRLYAAGLLAFLVFLPNLWWNLQHDFPTFQHTADISHLERAGGLQWAELGEFLGGQFAVFGPVFFAVLLYLVFRPRQNRPHGHALLLASFTLPFLLIICAQALLGRANANWAAPAYIAGSLWVVGWLLAGNRRILLGLGLGLNLFWMGAIYHYGDVTRALGVELTRSNDPFKRVRDWDRLAAEVAPILSRHPQATLMGNDRTLLAHLIYHLEPHPLDAVAWNPEGALKDHYQLTTSLADKRGQDFLMVTRNESLQELAPHFAQAEEVAHIVVPIHRDYVHEVRVYHLQGFKGY